jgi:hypothetical protein
MKSNRMGFSYYHPMLVTLQGDENFSLTGLIDSLGTAAAQATGLISTVKEGIAPSTVVVERKVDLKPFILPVTGLGLVLLIALLKK